ncbi:phage tail spike protein, partial [Bacillus tropicus]
TLQQQNLVLKEVRDGRIIPYVINNEVEKDSGDRSLTVHASGAWVQIAKDGIIKP